MSSTLMRVHVPLVVVLLDLMDYWICWIMDLLNDDLNITCRVEFFFIV